ncbi:MAG TPA: ubiquinol-cytochrome c reductase iron-sulfur subunit, partial [Clostridia bacterium]|nr:ubiquinol-cytochrome c reductase iron-sulfur subunit [Clostridia bacterium]
RFFRQLSLAVGGATAAMLGAPMVAFVLAPLGVKQPEVWRTVGRVEDFAVGETRDVRYEDASPLPWAGVTARTAAWLRRESETEFVAYSIHCTHLGCPVRWLKEAQLFMCPCHGGVFYKNGDVAAGPPDKPLARYPVRVENGEVQIQTGPLPLLANK